MPATTSITYRFTDPVPPNGTYMLTVRWYSEATGGEVLHQERQAIDIIDSITVIPLGRMNPIPENVWQRGARFLGMTLDGQFERIPRYAFVPVPLALAARRAEIADRLAPDINGVVTSINEAAGGIWILGENGVTVQRRGSVLSISSGRNDSLHSGRILGNDLVSTFQLTLPAPLLHPHDLRVSVATQDGSHVGIDVVNYDPSTNIVELRCTAILTKHDVILWSLRH